MRSETSPIPPIGTPPLKFSSLPRRSSKIPPVPTCFIRCEFCKKREPQNPAPVGPLLFDRADLISDLQISSRIPPTLMSGSALFEDAFVRSSEIRPENIPAYQGISGGGDKRLRLSSKRKNKSPSPPARGASNHPASAPSPNAPHCRPCPPRTRCRRIDLRHPDVPQLILRDAQSTHRIISK